MNSKALRGQIEIFCAGLKFAAQHRERFHIGGREPIQDLGEPIIQHISRRVISRFCYVIFDKSENSILRSIGVRGSSVCSVIAIALGSALCTAK